jgi:hypothetical protein
MVKWSADRTNLRIVVGSGEPTWQVVVRRRSGARWQMSILGALGRKEVQIAFPAADEVVVTAIDRTGNESQAERLSK